MRIVRGKKEKKIKVKNIEIGECFSFYRNKEILYLRLNPNQDYVSPVEQRSPKDHLYNVPVLEIDSARVTWVMGSAEAYPVKSKLVIK